MDTHPSNTTFVAVFDMVSHSTSQTTPIGVLVITIHRNSLLEDSFHAIMNVKDVQQLRWKLKVRFYGEEARSNDDDLLR